TRSRVPSTRRRRSQLRHRPTYLVTDRLPSGRLLGLASAKSDGSQTIRHPSDRHFRARDRPSESGSSGGSQKLSCCQRLSQICKLEPRSRKSWALSLPLEG